MLRLLLLAVATVSSGVQVGEPIVRDFLFPPGEEVRLSQLPTRSNLHPNHQEDTQEDIFVEPNSEISHTAFSVLENIHRQDTQAKRSINIASTEQRNINSHGENYKYESRRPQPTSASVTVKGKMPFDFSEKETPDVERGDFTKVQEPRYETGQSFSPAFQSHIFVSSENETAAGFKQLTRSATQQDILNADASFSIESLKKEPQPVSNRKYNTDSLYKEYTGSIISPTPRISSSQNQNIPMKKGGILLSSEDRVVDIPLSSASHNSSSSVNLNQSSFVIVSQRSPLQPEVAGLISLPERIIDTKDIIQFPQSDPNSDSYTFYNVPESKNKRKTGFVSTSLSTLENFDNFKQNGVPKKGHTENHSSDSIELLSLADDDVPVVKGGVVINLEDRVVDIPVFKVNSPSHTLIDEEEESLELPHRAKGPSITSLVNIPDDEKDVNRRQLTDYSLELTIPKIDSKTHIDTTSEVPVVAGLVEPHGKLEQLKFSPKFEKDVVVVIGHYPKDETCKTCKGTVESPDVPVVTSLVGSHVAPSDSIESQVVHGQVGIKTDFESEDEGTGVEDEDVPVITSIVGSHVPPSSELNPFQPTLFIPQDSKPEQPSVGGVWYSQGPVQGRPISPATTPHPVYFPVGSFRPVTTTTEQPDVPVYLGLNLGPEFKSRPVPSPWYPSPYKPFLAQGHERHTRQYLYGRGPSPTTCCPKTYIFVVPNKTNHINPGRWWHKQPRRKIPKVDGKLGFDYVDKKVPFNPAPNC